MGTLYQLHGNLQSHLGQHLIHQYTIELGWNNTVIAGGDVCVDKQEGPSKKKKKRRHQRQWQ